ncbi:MAG: hypothetical protein AB1726_05315 [Planctomycetota bacterium]
MTRSLPPAPPRPPSSSLPPDELEHRLRRDALLFAPPPASLHGRIQAALAREGPGTLPADVAGPALGRRAPRLALLAAALLVLLLLVDPAQLRRPPARPSVGAAVARLLAFPLPAPRIGDVDAPLWGEMNRLAADSARVAEGVAMSVSRSPLGRILGPAGRR